MARKHNGLFEILENFFTNTLPQIPYPARNFLVKLTPWFALLQAISLPLIIYALIIARPSNSFPTPNQYLDILIFIFIYILPALLSLFAIPGLLRLNLSGWNLLFFSIIISAIVHVLRPIHLVGELVLIYLLFQIRDRYK